MAADHDFELFVVLLPVRQQVQSRLLRDEPQRRFEETMPEESKPRPVVAEVVRVPADEEGREIEEPWRFTPATPQGHRSLLIASREWGSLPAR